MTTNNEAIDDQLHKIIEVTLVPEVTVNTQEFDLNSISTLDDLKAVTKNVKTKDTDELQKKNSEEVPIMTNERVSEKSNINSVKIPSPFKDILFWPNPVSVTTKRKAKDKVPSVASSEEWQAYHKQKQAKKIKTENDILLKRQNKLNKKNTKQKQVSFRKYYTETINL